MSNFIQSWAACERKAIEYFCGVLGSLEGVTAFSEQDFPRTMPTDDAEFALWKFTINGGAVGVQRQTRAAIEGGVWEMDAEFLARCTTDETAKTVAGTVFNSVPVLGSDIDGIARIYPTQYPSRERVIVNLENEANASQEVIMFEVRIPMRAVFGNME